MGLLFGRKKKRGPRRKSITRHIPFMRFIGPGSTLAGIVGLIGCLFTGQIDLASLDRMIGRGEVGVAAEPPPRPIPLHQLGQKSADSIRIATFNIKVFGKTKASDEKVMQSIARIVAQFDVVAIQEVRGGDAEPVQKLIDLLNASGARYTATVSQPIGRTSQVESYAYVWDETRIQMIPRSAYLVMDSADRMHREPMVASFQTRPGNAEGRQPFRFTLINAHTSPREVAASALDNEMNVLDDVYVSVRQFDYQQTGEEDFILLGDLNVDSKGLREMGQIPGVYTIAGDVKTNTRRTETYDHIMIDQHMTQEFTGRFGVMDLQQALGLTAEEEAAVSDHLPLWAEFSAYEVSPIPPAVAGTERTRR